MLLCSILRGPAELEAPSPLSPSTRMLQALIRHCNASESTAFHCHALSDGGEEAIRSFSSSNPRASPCHATSMQAMITPSAGVLTTTASMPPGSSRPFPLVYRGPSWGPLADAATRCVGSSRSSALAVEAESMLCRRPSLMTTTIPLSLIHISEPTRPY